jgi:hypothetical protein
MTPKSKSGKANAASEASKEIAKPAKTTGRKILGNSSLAWIADTTERESVLQESERAQDTKEIKPKETKIWVGKQFASEEAGEKKQSAPKPRPGISDNFSTITKGRKANEATKEEITVAEVIKNLGEENVAPMPKSPVEVPEIKAGKPAAAAEKTPARKEEKEILTVELIDEKAEGEAPHLPEDSSSIVKKANIGKIATVAPGKPEKAVGVKKAAVRKETLAKASVIRAKVAEPVRKGWSKIAGLGEPIKEGSRKVSQSVAKPFKKGKIKEAACSALNAAKQPVKTITAMDRNVTRSMKKVVLFGNPDSTGKSLLNNIREADARITRSTKEIIDSIL